jgi:hypothetical protein
MKKAEVAAKRRHYPGFLRSAFFLLPSSFTWPRFSSTFSAHGLFA